jgi:hypothetical protein
MMMIIIIIIIIIISFYDIRYSPQNKVRVADFV